MTIDVRYRIGNQAAIVEIDESKNWADVLNKVWDKLSPGRVIDKVDVVAQRILEQRKADGIPREREGEPAGDDEALEARGRAAAGADSSPAAGVRDTSKQAYRALRASGEMTKQQRELVDFLAANTDRTFTRQELADALGWGINRVCPRVHELLEKNVLREGAPRSCRITGERARPVEFLQPALEKAA